MKILIVDDNPDYRELLAIGLEAEGHEVVEAGCGETGLELLERESVDAVFLDLRMPGIGGVETLRRIRSTRSHALLPVIVMSGWDDPTVIEPVTARGPTGFVAKPHRGRDLLEALATVVDVSPGALFATA